MDNNRARIVRGEGALIAPLPFSTQEYASRLEKLRGLMEQRALDAFVSFTPENLYYVSGHDTPGYYFWQAMVVTHSQGPINVLRRIESSNTLGRGSARLAVPYEDREDPVEVTLDLLHQLGIADGTVGAEEDAWFATPARFQRLKDGIQGAGGKVVDASGLVEALRVIKSDEELRLIRSAAAVAARSMQAAALASREGTTEDEVAAQVVAEQIRAGGEYAGLPPFITSGPRTTLCHSTWSGRVFQRGDVLNFELPGVVKRYCAALYRVGLVGDPNREFARRVRVSQEALESVIDAIRPGVTSEEVHAVRKKVFQDHGFPAGVSSRTGYSVGVNYPPDWGEGHIFSIWDNDSRELREGMTFHLVPGLQGDSQSGGYHVCISETVLVTATGCEVLTNYSRAPFVV